MEDGGTEHEARSTPSHDAAGDADALPHSRTPALSHSPSPDSLAYVIYTSGSTGRPRGSWWSTGAAAGTVLAAAGAFGFREGEVVPALASYAFDIWAFEVFVPLVVGGTVRILPRERVRDVEALAREAAGADVLHAVPALMRETVAEVLRGGEPLRRMARLFVGGDGVPADLLGEMRRAFPAAAAWVLYGPTEGTVVCAAHRAGEGTRRQMPPGRRSRARRCTCWTPRGAGPRGAPRASCASAAAGWRAATWGGRS